MWPSTAGDPAVGGLTSTGPIVVGVMSHRDPPLVRKLVHRILQGRRAVVVVHHDPRGPELDLPESDRVHVMADARPCGWGQPELARAPLRMMGVAQSRHPDLSWFLLVSGQDYLCRPMRAIEDELAHSTYDAYLRHFRIDQDPAQDVHPWQQVCRRRYLHRIRLPRSHRSAPFPRRSPFGGPAHEDGLHLYAGDLWVNLNARAVEHVLHQRRATPEIERYLARCSVLDEALVPTLLLNGAPGLAASTERKRYIRWVPNEPHPAQLTADDAALAVAGGDFFARKCDTVQTAAALDVMDATLDSAQRLSPETGSA